MTDDTMRRIGERIKMARKANNITQSGLAEKTGISSTQLSNYETGKRGIGLVTLMNIAKALGVSLDSLCFGETSERPISTSKNQGELIVNCVAALFDEGVIAYLSHSKAGQYHYDGCPLDFRIGFGRHVSILNEFVSELSAYRDKESTYSNPEAYRKMVMESAANQINQEIEERKPGTKRGR